MKKSDLIIFTDLDGTLLNHYNYSWEEAQSALNELFLLDIPVIFCSSKTRMETIYYRGQIGIEHPFIVENGAAIYCPMGYFQNPVSQIQKEGYEVLELGTAYFELREFLEYCKKELGIRLLGFGDLDTEQVQELTDLPMYLADLARRREYNEPFYFLDEESEDRLGEIKQLAAQRNLTITRGGRFYHISGSNDKGKAVQQVNRLFRENYTKNWRTVGIGDSLNDLPMLLQVDIPCLVLNSRKQYNQEIVSQISPRLAEDMGAKGWSNLIFQLLDEYRNE